MLFESLLIALFCYLGWIATPWLGGQPIGWHVFGKPLVAGTIVGLILGDVKTGMIIGATINAIYIGAITPGGAMAADINFAGYIGTAIAMMTHVNADIAVSIAVPLGLLGTLTWQLFATGNAFTGHLAEKFIEKKEFGKFGFCVWGLPQIFAFLIRFIPAFLVLYFGAPIAQNILNYIPPKLTHSLSVIGGMLPAIGMAVLLKMLFKPAKYARLFYSRIYYYRCLSSIHFDCDVAGISRCPHRIIP